MIPFDRNESLILCFKQNTGSHLGELKWLNLKKFQTKNISLGNAMIGKLEALL